MKTTIFLVLLMGVWTVSSFAYFNNDRILNIPIYTDSEEDLPKIQTPSRQVDTAPQSNDNGPSWVNSDPFQKKSNNKAVIMAKQWVSGGILKKIDSSMDNFSTRSLSGFKKPTIEQASSEIDRLSKRLEILIRKFDEINGTKIGSDGEWAKKINVAAISSEIDLLIQKLSSMLKIIFSENSGQA
jgi:hypothetical protein